MPPADAIKGSRKAGTRLSMYCFRRNRFPTDVYRNPLQRDGCHGRPPACLPESGGIDLGGEAHQICFRERWRKGHCRSQRGVVPTAVDIIYSTALKMYHILRSSVLFRPLPTQRHHRILPVEEGT